MWTRTRCKNFDVCILCDITWKIIIFNTHLFHLKAHLQCQMDGNEFTTKFALLFSFPQSRIACYFFLFQDGGTLTLLITGLVSLHFSILVPHNFHGPTGHYIATDNYIVFRGPMILKEIFNQLS